MTQKYYDITDGDYPPIIISLMERLRYYYCSLLYPDETYSDSKKRFIRTDIGNFAIRDSSKVYNITNAEFPFTAFGYGDPDINRETYNRYADTGKYYCDDLTALVDTKPLKLQIPMVSFFTTGYDWFRALSILSDAQMDGRILQVPIIVNSISTTFPIRIEIEDIGKGNYAWEFEQQLITGKIHDITHYTTIYYYDFKIDTQLAPVDDIEVGLAGYSQDDYNDNISVSSGVVPDTPVVSSTVPVDDATDVSTSGNVTINFNVEMNETSTIDNITIFPYIWCSFSWNEDSDVLTIDPIENFENETLYTITLDKEIISGDEIPMEDDYEFSFEIE